MFIAVAMLVAAPLFAQQNSELSTENTFELHSRNAEQELQFRNRTFMGPTKDCYATVLKTFDMQTLDGYRFLNKRRSIDFVGTEMYITLFSAEELKTMYGKAIPENTIKEGETYHNVTFKIDRENFIVIPQNLD
jgi:hypothetical protein